MELIIGIITLLIAIATLYVSYISYCYTRKSDKRHKLEKLKRKEAILKGMEEHMRWGQTEVSAAAHLRVEIAGLKAEIEQLKSEL